MIDEYVSLSADEHARLKSGMYIGSTVHTSMPLHMYDATVDKIRLESGMSSEGLLKLFDEAIVNAQDRWYELRQLATTPTDPHYKVTRIDVTYDVKEGVFSVMNNGDGFQVHTCTSGKNAGRYWPELLICEMFTGSNMFKKSNKKGGTNGLGIKLINFYSRYMMIDTVDAKRHLSYRQRYENRGKIITPPEVHGAPGNMYPYTRITFRPCYEDAFGQQLMDIQTGAIKPCLALDIVDRWLRARLMQTASCVGRDCVVTYNGAMLPIRNLSDLFLKFDGVAPDNVTRHEFNDDMQIAVCVRPGTAQFMGTVNGVASHDGTHKKFFEDQIIDALKATITKDLNKYNIQFHDTFVTNNLFIMAQAVIPDPIWDAQNKTRLKVSSEVFEKYILPQTFITHVAERITKMLRATILVKAKQSRDKYLKSAEARSEKYQAAGKAGQRGYAYQCILYLPEGDSPAGMLLTGLVEAEYDSDYYGIYTLGGVPMNARKQVDVEQETPTSPKILVQHRELMENKVWVGLVKILNLDYDKTYSFGPAGDAEFNTLTYGKLVVAADQDLDGAGQIFGQVINFFQLFWPCLVERGYIYRLLTPVVRMFPKNPDRDDVLEFYTEEEAQQATANPIITEKYEMPPKYYKGLGAHEAWIRGQMLEKPIEKHLLRYFPGTLALDGTVTMDRQTKIDTEKLFEIYFADDSEGRKRELRTPLIMNIPLEQLVNTKLWAPIMHHIRTYTKAFHLDNIVRHIPCYNDGLVITTRKILAYVRDSPPSKDEKIFQTGGGVAKYMNYHHGDASINGAITNMCQQFMGARRMPLLLPDGTQGSRRKGGKDAASPRYLGVTLNRPLVKALFPVEDDYLLKYDLEDGKQYQPASFMPVAPLVLMDFIDVVGTGWNTTSYPRDPFAINQKICDKIVGSCAPYNPSSIANVSVCVPNLVKVSDGTTTTTVRTFDKQLPPDRYGFTGDVITTSTGAEYCIGKANIDFARNLVIVTELPFLVWTNKYVEGLSEWTVERVAQRRKDEKNDSLEPFFIKIKSDSGENNVHIEITFVPNVLQIVHMAHRDQTFPELSKYSGVYKFLHLIQPLTPNINFVNDDKTIREFNSYNEVFDAWFDARQKMYIKRSERQAIVLRMRILMQEQIIKYMALFNGMKLAEMSDEQQEAILKQQGLLPMDSHLANEPKFTPVNEIENMVLRGPHASYDYLLNMSARKLSTKAQLDARALLVKLKTELYACENEDAPLPRGSRQWLRELQEFDAVIRKGYGEGWMTTKHSKRNRAMRIASK